MSMKADGKNAVADGKVNNKPDSGISGIGGSGLKHETQTRNEPPALLSVRPLAEGRMGTEAEASTRKTSESSGNSQMFDAKQIPEKASKSKLKETPKIRIPSFLAKHMERSAAYSRYFIPAYTRLSKILSKSVGEYAL
ncbi:MAG: hypothetical protein QW112_02890, partial [Candidatus Micrarchaeia archaeon]